jgi:hypothetical protein
MQNGKWRYTVKDADDKEIKDLEETKLSAS